MNKLETIKSSFYLDKNKELDLYNFGKYRMGLTDDEIKNYLRARAGKLRVERLYKKFCDIAGCNTMTSVFCEGCNTHTCLMYRHDILRFADVLFGKTEGTYFD